MNERHSNLLKVISKTNKGKQSCMQNFAKGRGEIGLFKKKGGAAENIQEWFPLNWHDSTSKIYNQYPIQHERKRTIVIQVFKSINLSYYST